MRTPRAPLVSPAGLVSLAGLLPVQASAQVVLDQWGTFATTVSSDCADFCDPDTDVSWLLGLTFGPQNGGEAVELDQTANGLADITQVLAVPVSPGDQFNLVASSAASAGGVGAFAESLGTLSVCFGASDAANLEVASGVGAPVPALRWPCSHCPSRWSSVRPSSGDAGERRQQPDAEAAAGRAFSRCVGAARFPASPCSSPAAPPCSAPEPPRRPGGRRSR